MLNPTPPHLQSAGVERHATPPSPRVLDPTPTGYARSWNSPARFDDYRLRVEVLDDEPRGPVTNDGPCTGLRIVEQLCDVWGWEHSGKPAARHVRWRTRHPIGELRSSDTIVLAERGQCGAHEA